MIINKKNNNYKMKIEIYYKKLRNWNKYYKWRGKITIKVNNKSKIFKINIRRT